MGILNVDIQLNIAVCKSISASKLAGYMLLIYLLLAKASCATVNLWLSSN